MLIKDRLVVCTHVCQVVGREAKASLYVLMFVNLSIMGGRLGTMSLFIPNHLAFLTILPPNLMAVLTFLPLNLLVVLIGCTLLISVAIFIVERPFGRSLMSVAIFIVFRIAPTFRRTAPFSSFS